MERYKLENLDCADCARRIEEGLKRCDFVRDVSINFSTLSMNIDTDDMKSVVDQVKRIDPDVSVDTSNAATRAEGNKGDGNETGRSQTLKPQVITLASSIFLFVVGLILNTSSVVDTLPWITYPIFAVAYLLAGFSVLKNAALGIFNGRIFDENALMTIATAGAWIINQIPEAVAVMIFYKIGDLLQERSIRSSRKSIRELLDLRPDTARVKRNGSSARIAVEAVQIGEIVEIRPGERVPLDGTIVEGTGFFDTSSLTGEPVPKRIAKGEEILAGYIDNDASIRMEVTRPAGESSADKIIKLVEEASHAKARTEQFISRFARYYTPAVVVIAAAIAFLPPLLSPSAELTEWVYRALTILVISCPCALVVSIPLGYFGGIGGASRNGVLVKGASFFDVLARVKTVVFDKTGTLTKGVFRVLDVAGESPEDVLEYAAYAEARSNHPIAESIRHAYREDNKREIDESRIADDNEVGGHGVVAAIDGRTVVAGNDRLLHREGISHPICEEPGTVVHVAYDGTYLGYITIGDELKSGARETIEELKSLGITRATLLTGDSVAQARDVAEHIGLDAYYGNLLPEDKVSRLEQELTGQNNGEKTLFVGDGINDAPVIARADVGAAMGTGGSDAAIESADLVLTGDSPLKVAEAVRRAHRTRRVVLQNIAFAIGAKLVFLTLGALGIATMWEAVIADVGVTLIAVLNAARTIR